MEKKCNLASITRCESLRKVSAQLGIKDLNQGGVFHFLGLEGPPTTGVLPVGSGEGWHLFSLGDCLGVGAGRAAVDGCSSTGKAFCGRMVGMMGVLAPVEGDMRWPWLL